jgi:beta-glucosidase
LKTALASGQISQPIIDDKVRRILRTAVRFSFFDRPQQDDNISTYDSGGRAVAYDAALASITLLRNEHGTLPLDLTKIRTIAVIGPDAQPAVVGGGGSSETMPFVSVSFLDGVAQRLGQKVNVLYARGIPSLANALRWTHAAGLS